MASMKVEPKKIADIIDVEVRPMLQAHGGDIQLVEITEDGWVRVKLTGACGTCPGIQQTLNEVVEKSLRKEYPEMRVVIPVMRLGNELIQEALRILRKNKPESEGMC